MRNKNDIDKLQEWHDHQYDPGYWINKYPLFFPPKKTLGNWIISLINFLVFIPAFLFSCWRYFVERNEGYLILVGSLCIFSIVATLYLIRFIPDFNRKKSQAETEEQNRIENKGKKRKLPKRRKDYN